MAEIKRFPFIRHLRAEPNAHVIVFIDGHVKKSGLGLATWFFPLRAAIAEVPTDDRPVALTVHARSADFQDVTVQGVIGYRILDPERAARRIDFSIDLSRGQHLREPLDKIALLLSQVAQEHAAAWIGTTRLTDVLARGTARVREAIHAALSVDPLLAELGIELTSVRVASVVPTPDLERALEAPIREGIQQQADEAAFARRALAVEKERAIQENELQNRIELSRRQAQLIEQEGKNQSQKALDESHAKQVSAEGEALRKKLLALAEAESIRALESPRIDAERARMEIARATPAVVLFALAARELAAKLQRIDHLHLGAELAPLLSELVAAGTRALEAGEVIDAIDTSARK